MSPGATFERVYNELKRMLAEGELPPGSSIEPALIGKQIASSITPIRDALHRLTGERLVEAPNHNGFRVPMPTEAGLRDLYAWNGQLLGVAVRTMRHDPASPAGTPSRAAEDIRLATASLFAMIAQATGSAEHARTVRQSSDRLAPFRRIETHLFTDLAGEYAELARLYSSGDRATLGKAIAAYHRRRAREVPRALATLTSGISEA